MGDTEYLISCVEAHPCVWDPSLPEYHDRERKEAAWRDICRAVVPRWASYTEQEQLLKRLDVKKKWSNCRDYYKKDMQRGHPPVTDRRKRRYVFADHLRFLDKVIKGPGEHNETVEDEQKADDILIVEVGEGMENEGKIKINNQDGNPELKTKSPREMFNDFLNITHNKSYRDRDDDEKYLLSFRSEMRKMTHVQRIDFKLGMMQLVKNIFREEISSKPAPTSSHNFTHSSSVNNNLSPQYLLEEDSPSD